MVCYRFCTVYELLSHWIERYSASACAIWGLLYRLSFAQLIRLWMFSRISALSKVCSACTNNTWLLSLWSSSISLLFLCYGFLFIWLLLLWRSWRDCFHKNDMGISVILSPSMHSVTIGTIKTYGPVYSPSLDNTRFIHTYIPPGLVENPIPRNLPNQVQVVVEREDVNNFINKRNFHGREAFLIVLYLFLLLLGF